MEINYDQVPDIISGKDLDYLSDMFTWNYGVYKSTLNAINNVQDKELVDMLEKSANIFYEVMSNILNILNNGGSNE